MELKNTEENNNPLNVFKESIKDGIEMRVETVKEIANNVKKVTTFLTKTTLCNVKKGCDTLIKKVIKF